MKPPPTVKSPPLPGEGCCEKSCQVTSEQIKADMKAATESGNHGLAGVAKQGPAAGGGGDGSTPPRPSADPGTGHGGTGGRGARPGAAGGRPRGGRAVRKRGGTLTGPTGLRPEPLAEERPTGRSMRGQGARGRSRGRGAVEGRGLELSLPAEHQEERPTDLGARRSTLSL